MSFAPANEGIAKLKPYQPGKPISELERELGMTDIVKLASNENPLGCSDKVKEAVAAELAEIGRYPDGGGFILKDQIHAQFGVAHDCITLGNGSNDLLEIFARAFVSDKDSVVYSQHAFAVYALVTQAINAEAIEVPAQGFSHDLDAMAAAIKDNTKLVFIANPNNPSGTYLSKKEIRELMSKIPRHVIVVLDGAYAEYVMEKDYDVDFSLVKEFDNIILTRTFSKAYGLAGIRLGWCYASPRVASILSRVKGPFNTNSLAQHMAIIALNDQDHIKMVTGQNKKNKEWFEGELTKLDIKFLPSYANFSFIKSTKTDAAKMSETLLENGIIVRQLDSYNLPHCLRITIGTMEDMKKTIKALENIS